MYFSSRLLLTTILFAQGLYAIDGDCSAESVGKGHPNIDRDCCIASESVRNGHPDKVCDLISDGVLDYCLSLDPNARVACNVVATKGPVVVTGEITVKGDVNIERIVRDTLKKIGYNNPAFGIDCNTCPVIVSISKQSPDIALGVNATGKHEQGAGDQGMMYGYACKDTPELMPLPIMLAHGLTRRLDTVFAQGLLPWLRPDGKAQVSIKYHNGVPQYVTTVVVSAQHDPSVSHEEIEKAFKKEIIEPVCAGYLREDTRYFINPTGNFVTGGPQGDSGLTGRKIIVDTYGGIGRHGGGAFSGKDPSKVDRSAAYMARHIAKNIVAADLADRCEIQVAYSIGIAEPVSIYVDCFGTAKVSEAALETAVRAIFPLKPAEIITYLHLKERPIYQKTASYGHFGRNDPDFTWEHTNKVAELKAYFHTN